MIGFPYLFIGIVDLSLAEVLVIGSFWFSLIIIFSFYSVFIKSVLPLWSTTVIIFGSSSVVAAIVLSLFPGVIGMFLSRISFLVPLPYTGPIVVFSISSVLSCTFSSSIGVLHFSVCSVSFGSGWMNLPSIPLAFPPFVILKGNATPQSCLVCKHVVCLLCAELHP